MGTKFTKQPITYVKFAMPDTGQLVWGRVTDMVTRDNDSHYVVKVADRKDWTDSWMLDNGETITVHWQSIVDGKTIRF